ncbi:MAG: hypothetical protein AAFP99_11610, partial [Pseudomonadota bacterium]
VGRSEDVFGPFLDQQGQDMMDGGGTLVLAARDHEIGPGHATIYTAPSGETSISYHYYDARRDGLPWIGEAEIEWRDGCRWCHEQVWRSSRWHRSLNILRVAQHLLPT